MSALMTANLVLAGIDALLALVVGVVYLRTHREIRSPFTFALALFAAFFLFHNAVLVYHYVSMMGSFGAVGEWFILVEGLLQTVALGALTYAVTR